MSVELTVSLISAVVALCGAILTAVLGARAAKARLELQAEIEQQQAARRKYEERQDLMSRIRDPLLWAAFDFQSRLFNVVAQQFLSEYLVHGSAEERTYAQRNTLFVLAQYLGWVEIVRRRVQFLDLGNRQENLRLVNSLSKISGVLSSDSFSNRIFRIFRGDQRAIGELMVNDSADGELACIGYAEFSVRMDNDSSFTRWLAPLSTDIEQLATTAVSPQSRLVVLQRNLIDLIDILDPEYMRFPDRHRRKLYQYNVVINKRQPCCFILLVDQSSSMNHRIAGTTIRKQEAAADAVNGFLYEAVLRCSRQEEVRDYFYVGVFDHDAGKGDVKSAFGEDFVAISKIAELAKPPQRRFGRKTGGHGSGVQRPEELPIWFEPVATGRTMMIGAFERAFEAATNWTLQHPAAYPPIIINITGGDFPAKDTFPVVSKIQKLTTQAGNALVFNCHISETEGAVVMYPGPARTASFGERARQLYQMSSILPEPMHQQALRQGYDLEPGARGYILNTDAASIVDLLEIGTRAVDVSELTHESD